MNIRPIRGEADYDWALAEIERNFDDEPKPNTADADRFNVLADLIEAYEARRSPVEDVGPPNSAAAPRTRD